MKSAAGALVALMLMGPVTALGQDSQYDEARLREMQRSSAERDRQSDAFALWLRQQQSELQAAPRDLPALQNLHAAQRRDFDRLLDEQRATDRGADAVTWGPRLDTGPQMKRERREAIGRAARESGSASP